jgi:hypothetical protein
LLTFMPMTFQYLCTSSSTMASPVNVIMGSIP